MFKDCQSLVSINFSNFTCPVNMEYMFYSCKKLKSIDLSNLIIPKRTSMKGFFSGTSSLKSIIIKVQVNFKNLDYYLKY